MKFELNTLIDITETGARRGEDVFKYKQQQNFLTLFQTISLRANPILKKSPAVREMNISNMGFGKKYNGKHKVWTLYFEFESDKSHSIDFLKNDVNFVPIIINLDETILLDPGAFITTDEQTTNITFKEVDDK